MSGIRRRRRRKAAVKKNNQSLGQFSDPRLKTTSKRGKLPRFKVGKKFGGGVTKPKGK